MRAWFASLVALVIGIAGCLDGPPQTPSPGAQDDRSGAPGEDGALWAWQRHAGAPTPRTEVTVAALGQKIYVIGGFSGAGVVTRTVEIYDAATDSWTSGPDYPILLHHSAAVSHEGAIYVLGGYTTQAFVATSLAFRFTPAAGFAPIAPLPTERGAHGAAVAEGKIYVVGGVGTDGLLRSVHVYDPRANTWTSAAELPTPRDHLAVAAHDGIVYAAGGRKQTLSSNLGTLEAFDPATGRWETREAMPTPRGGIAAAALDGEIVVLGGEENAGTFDEAEAYDPGTNAWRSLSPMPSPRHGLGAATVAGRLYAMLGGPEPGFTVSGAVESLGPSGAP